MTAPTPDATVTQRNRLPSLVLFVAIVGVAYLLGRGFLNREEGGPAPVDSGAETAVVQQDEESPGEPERIRWQGHELMPQAQWERHEDLVLSRNLPFSLADGGGEVRLVEGDQVMASGRGRWVVEYRAGPHGIAVGGSLHFQIPPFWFWEQPQVRSARAGGYTTVEVSRPGTTLDIAEAPWVLTMDVQGEPLVEGDTVTVTYGAGEAGARADRYAEGKEFFHFWVDGDGDRTRKLVSGAAEISIAPRPASDFVVWLPSTAAPGETVSVQVAFLDPVANAAPDFVGEVHLAAPEGLRLPASITFEEEHRGQRRIEAVVEQEGLYVVTAELHDPESQEEDTPVATRQSNTMLCETDPVRVYWGDLHGHSTWSDGSATPEEYFRYARDFAGLDVTVLTDHDHHGLVKLDETPELWQRLQDVADEFHAPRRFVTLYGYEWTSWLYGHRHVLYFRDRGEVYSAVDEASDTPAELWALLGSRDDALTVAHHSGGGPVPTDWSFAPPPELEPVVEIVSVHGSSESVSTPLRIRNATPGAFAVDALLRGYRLGFIGSGDSHDGHPGLPQRNAICGGLAGIMADELTRDGVLQALRRRSVYATSGPRIYLQFSLGDVPMGGTYHHREGDPVPPYHVRAVGAGPLEHIELVKNGKPILRARILGSIDAEFDHQDDTFQTGEFMYVRVHQEDGGVAWSSPIWIEAAD